MQVIDSVNAEHYKGEDMKNILKIVDGLTLGDLRKSVGPKRAPEIYETFCRCEEGRGSLVELQKAFTEYAATQVHVINRSQK